MHDDEAREVMHSAVVELERGEPFHSVVDRYSDCKAQAGHLGTFSRGYMVQEFDDVVFALKPGERSGIFRTFLGYHVAVLHSKEPPKPLRFEQVRGDIDRAMNFQMQQEALRDAVAVLRRSASIRRIPRQDAEKILNRALDGEASKK